jgi:monoamine oxidase
LRNKNLKQVSNIFDVAIIGAGAAGIAAARKCHHSKLNYAVFEARDRVGGRAHTININGQALDTGAHWMHFADVNPLVSLAKSLSFKTIVSPTNYPRYDNGKLQNSRKNQILSKGWQVLSQNADKVNTSKNDKSLEDCLPTELNYPELKDWINTLAFGLGLYSGRDIKEVSAYDYAQAKDYGNKFIYGGYGTLIALLAKDLNIKYSSPITSIDWHDKQIKFQIGQEIFETHKLIITIPVMVLTKNTIKFSPNLPSKQRAAIEALKPAAYEHVIIYWQNHPFKKNKSNQLTLFKGERERNISMLTAIEGTDFHYVEIGGSILTGFSGTSEQKKTFSAQLALDELTRHFGVEHTQSINIIHITDWWNDPYSCGSWSVAPPNLALARKLLQHSLGEKIWFAGEASSISQAGTVGGAWLEGERAAASIIKLIKNPKKLALNGWQ